MPCFNSEEYVTGAVESVLRQTYPHVELIVVDDGSSDRSRDILRSYGSRIILIEQQNKGPYPARNRGIREARGEFVAFLDADDYWSPDFLTKMHKALTDANAALAYCGWQNVGEGAPGGQPYIPPKYEEYDIVKAFLKGCPWPIHAALVRRDIIEKLGGFSERYQTSMDYDLWIRLSSITQNILLVPAVLSFYRWHDAGQISSIKWRQVLNSWNVRRDFIRDNGSLVAHIENKALRQMTHGYLLDCGYMAFWKRDLISARHLFRKVFMTGYWSLKDIKYIVPSLLPEKVYCSLIKKQ